jgi:hypothetical protein
MPVACPLRCIGRQNFSLIGRLAGELSGSFVVKPEVKTGFGSSAINQRSFRGCAAF